MNTNLVTIVKQIITGCGEAALADPQRLKALFNDLAKEEPKPLRIAFGRCIEAGAYNALKTAPDSSERAERKATIARRVRDEHELDMALCAEALDILEAALFGVQSTVPLQAQSEYQQQDQGQRTLPKPPETSPYVPPQSGAIPAAAKAVVTEPLTKNPPPIAALIAVSVAVIAAITVFALWSMNVAEKKRERQRIAQEQERERQRLAVANMVSINGGTFTMGSPAPETDHWYDAVQHRVTVSSFYMGKYEVTQREWREVMGNNPSKFMGDDLPVEKVSWYDAIEYCNKRSQREGLTPAYTIDKSRNDPNNTAPTTSNGENVIDTIRWLVTWNRNANGYRLPTEAEWEYACRAGTTTPFSTGDNITTDQANYRTYRETTPAGSFAPNAWGLYDMHGNVDEWCWDWYGNYSRGAQTDPMGAGSGSDRVVRGGSWGSLAQLLRSARRISFAPAYRYADGGFRLVRSEF
jgi:formylglycine-generating enzyme required for sulfatase activity